jgi:dolichyl-phosphate-mannose-protein mannosyltransferase
MVAIPIALYIASYIQMFLQPHDIPAEYNQIGPLTLGPINLGPGTLPDSSWWSMFVGEQWQMWHYHTTLTAGHPYYSKWWQWLLDIRPVFYYVDRSTDGYVANTYNLGNPLLYWGFPLAILLGLWLLWRKRDLRLAFILAATAINWLPWALSPRGMFFYHFLPTVPFLVLLVAYCLCWLWRQPSRAWHRVAGVYVALVFVSFAFFYTQLAAWPVPEWYADIHYWLPSWQ